MDRGTPGRPADGTDETVERTDAIDAAVDDDAHEHLTEAATAAGSTTPPGPMSPGPSRHDTASEPGPPGEPGPPERAAGPPAHWLAYIRARAPGLLAPGGALAALGAEGAVGAGDVVASDVIPHGPGAWSGPWPEASDPGRRPGTPDGGSAGM